MSRRPTRMRVNQRASCYRKCLSQKVGFRTYDEALAAAELMMLRGHVKPGCHITPYQCDECDEWHVWNRWIVFGA